MKLEIIYGVDGNIAGHRVFYYPGCAMTPVEDNEYVIGDDDDLEKLTDWLVKHPHSKVIPPSVTGLRVPLKALKEKVKKHEKLTKDEEKAWEIAQKPIKR